MSTTWRWYPELSAISLALPPESEADRWVMLLGEQDSRPIQRIGRDWKQVLIPAPTPPFELQITTSRRRRRSTAQGVSLPGDARNLRRARFDPSLQCDVEIQPEALTLHTAPDVELELQSHCWPTRWPRPRSMWRHRAPPRDTPLELQVADLAHPGSWTFLEISPARDGVIGPTVGCWLPPSTPAPVRARFIGANASSGYPSIEFEVGRGAIRLPPLTIIQFRPDGVARQRSIPIDLTSSSQLVHLPDALPRDRFGVIGADGVVVGGELQLPNGVRLALSRPTVEYRGPEASPAFRALDDWHPQGVHPSAAERLTDQICAWLTTSEPAPSEAIRPALRELADRVPGLLAELQRADRPWPLTQPTLLRHLGTLPQRVLVQWLEMISSESAAWLRSRELDRGSLLELLFDRPQQIQPLVRDAGLTALAARAPLPDSDEPLHFPTLLARLAGDPPGLTEWLDRAGPREWSRWSTWLLAGRAPAPLVELRWRRRLHFDLEQLPQIQAALEGLTHPGWTGLAGRMISGSPLARRIEAALRERQRVLAGEVEGSELLAAHEALLRLTSELSELLTALPEQRPSVPGRWSAFPALAHQLRDDPPAGLTTLKEAEKTARAEVERLPGAAAAVPPGGSPLVLDRLLDHLQLKGAGPHRAEAAAALSWLGALRSGVHPWPESAAEGLDGLDHEEIIQGLRAHLDALPPPPPQGWQALLTALALGSVWSDTSDALTANLARAGKAGTSLRDADPRGRAASVAVLAGVDAASTRVQTLTAIALHERAAAGLDVRRSGLLQRLSTADIGDAAEALVERLGELPRGGLPELEPALILLDEVTRALSAAEGASRALRKRVAELPEPLRAGLPAALPELSAQLEERAARLDRDQRQRVASLTEEVAELETVRGALGGTAPTLRAESALEAEPPPADGDINETLDRIQATAAAVEALEETRQTTLESTQEQARQAVTEAVDEQPPATRMQISAHLEQQIIQGDWNDLLADLRRAASLREVSGRSRALLQGRGDGVAIGELLWLGADEEPLTSLRHARALSLRLERQALDDDTRESARQAIADARQALDDHGFGSLAGLRQHLFGVLQNRLYRLRTEGRGELPESLLPPSACSTWGALLWVSAALQATGRQSPFSGALRVPLIPLPLPEPLRPRFEHLLDHHGLIPREQRDG